MVRAHARTAVVWSLALHSLLCGCNVYDRDLVGSSAAPALDAAGHPSRSDDVRGDAACGGGGCGGSSAAGASERTSTQCDASICQPDLPADQPDRELMLPRDAGTAAVDHCKNDPAKTEPGACGCGVPDADRDLDGTPDCNDACPIDADKTSGGVCGCGRSDVDADGDGTPDCADGCPRDAAKTAVGTCGCGQPDLDQDGDGSADCMDACPDDAIKTSPGICGCGQTDPSDAVGGELYCVRGQLAHRYSFDGTGAIATDSIAGADGVILSIVHSQQADGVLKLSGDLGSGYGDEGYVTLPTTVWQGLTSATFEAWVTWQGKGPVGGSPWQRIFDFGDQVLGQAHSYLFLTPEGQGGVRVAFSLDGNDPMNEVSVLAPMPLPLKMQKHVAVVVDAESSSLALYVDGVAQGSVRMHGQLAEINCANMWLGRSNFTEDPGFFGTLHEFRVYTRALNAQQLQASFAAGPDYRFLPQ
jgi:hypothetical protein